MAEVRIIAANSDKFAMSVLEIAIFDISDKFTVFI